MKVCSNVTTIYSHSAWSDSRLNVRSLDDNTLYKQLPEFDMQEISTDAAVVDPDSMQPLDSTTQPDHTVTREPISGSYGTTGSRNGSEAIEL